MPPAALISSTASVMPLCVDWPNVASDPVSEPYSPTTMSAASLFGAQDAAASAAMTASTRFMVKPSWLRIEHSDFFCGERPIAAEEFADRSEDGDGIVGPGNVRRAVDRDEARVG